MKELGKHLIVEMYGCDHQLINDINFVEKSIFEAAVRSKATVIEGKFHTFAPHGISGVLIIAESHFAIHTWPEYGYCAVDIFTCGDLTENSLALEYLKKEFKAEYYSAVEMKRGLLNLPDEQIKFKPDIENCSK